MPMILVPGQPLLDKSQSIAEAEHVEALLECESEMGPDWDQARVRGYLLPMGWWASLALVCGN